MAGPGPAASLSRMRLASIVLTVGLALASRAFAVEWLKRPDAAVMAKAYPAVVADLDIEGRATLDCQITAQGLADPCTIASEAPAGLGFGAAALQVSRAFRFKPPNGDAKVQAPLRFVTPVRDPPPALRKPTTVTPARLDLARRIMELGGGAAFATAQIEGLISPGLSGPPAPGADPVVWADATAAIHQAVADGVPPLLDALALQYASENSEAELQRTLALAEQPATRDGALMARPLKDDRILRSRVAQIRAAARAAFCGKHAC